MRDLVCVVADRNMEATVKGVLARPEALGIRHIEFEVLVHPRRDPGCFHEPDGLLRGYCADTRHALVLLDQGWQGAPGEGAEETEWMLENRLISGGLGDWARAVVIEPELEVWVFSDSPHVTRALGWDSHGRDLRSALDNEGLWPRGNTKPQDPKRSLEWALRQVRKPRSSSIYRDLAERVRVGAGIALFSVSGNCFAPGLEPMAPVKLSGDQTTTRRKVLDSWKHNVVSTASRNGAEVV